jgi:hypothetical protein
VHTNLLFWCTKHAQNHNMTKPKITNNIGDEYIKKLRKKITSVEKTIFLHENNYVKEKNKRAQLWDEITKSNLKLHKEKLETQIAQSQEIANNITNILHNEYEKLANLKRAEASAFEARAAWIVQQNPFEIQL